MAKIDSIETIVVVIMENRSFDHMLGYLSLPEFGKPIDGLRGNSAWLAQVANPFGGHSYPPFAYEPLDLPADPPHERANIATQLGALAGNSYPMNGFVENYAAVTEVAPEKPPAVMGYYTPRQAPITHFFAENFAVCDRWFASLPTGTQPNRLMAMAGSSKIDGNVGFLSFPQQDLVYDWLTRHDVRWRVYHQSMPFFMLMKTWLPEILADDLGETFSHQGKHFRDLDQLVIDVQDEDPSTFPQVIFVEPKYTDAPPAGSGSDDHPPTSIAGGQAFLWKVYLSLISNPARWMKTALLLTYDENGGFFDHVSPPGVVTNPPQGADYPKFASLGVRVPGMVISPLVSQGRVYSDLLDHTSILKFLGQKFNGGSYSDEVDARDPRIKSVGEVVNLDAPRAEILQPPSPSGNPVVASVQIQAFTEAARRAYTVNDPKARLKFPETWHV
jgi:phospholipase C